MGTNSNNITSTKIDFTNILGDILKGAGIVFAGSIIMTGLMFVVKVLIARYLEVDKYGTYSLALTIISVFSTVLVLGLPNVLPREVAYYSEKNRKLLSHLVSSVIFFIILVGCVSTFLLVMFSDRISTFFNDPNLAVVFNFFSLMIPFSLLTKISISIFRGIGRTKEQLYYQNVLYPLLSLLLTVLVIYLRLSWELISLVYVIPVIVISLLLMIRLFRTFSLPLIFDIQILKDILKKALFLMLTGIFGLVLSWMDTLMIGYYLSSTDVGLYNIASSLSRMLLLVLNSVSFLYLPLITKVYVNEGAEKISMFYSILSKWILVLTSPLFFYFVVFPGNTIYILFGDRYLPAKCSLVFLSFGFMFHSFFALNGWTLVVLGDTKFIFISNLTAASFNVILNMLLIPLYGIEGASIATMLSYVIVNLLNSSRLYRKFNISNLTFDNIVAIVILWSFLLFSIALKQYFIYLNQISVSIFFTILISVSYLLLLYFLGIIGDIENQTLSYILSAFKSMLS